ncbi:MAG: hypothetical protein PHZ19_11205 [Candidatus Thermoplasmatota archaeon]|nr:hypothetical protein [Candidatus Thermoplasmatota archaeon]
MSENTQLERVVKLDVGHYRIRFEGKWKDTCAPGTTWSHEWEVVWIRCIVRGHEGGVQFVIMTDWVPQLVGLDKPLLRWWHGGMPDGLGNVQTELWYHSATPLYDGQEPLSERCECTGGICYSRESTHGASDAMSALVNGGDGALWSFLETYYEHVFHGGPFPTPTEYPKSDEEKNGFFDFAAQLVRATAAWRDLEMEVNHENETDDR